MEPAICRPFYGFIPGADDGGHESIIPTTDEGNWDDLPHKLVSKVAKILLRCDVTDFVRLRTVKAWRGAVTDPKLMGMNPRHWKMLQIPGEQARFVNVLTGASIRVKIPQEHGQVIASAEGCLLLASGTHKVCLFNPVTGAAANLPTPFFWIRANGVTVTGDIKAAAIIYDGDAVPTPTVVLLVTLFSIDMVKYARPSDAVWQWRYFAPNEDGELLRPLEPQPHFVYAARQEATQASHLHLHHLRSYLVPSVDAGMLLVVRRFENHVFQVNLAEGTLTLLQDQKDIGNRSIFHRWLTLGTQ
ncbi:hypothetical protein VPH35_125022 [Triticum aestivum]